MAGETVLQRAFIEHERELIGFLTARLGCRSLASDIAQDLYLKLNRSSHEAAVRNNRAYLFSMAANLATDHLRVERRRTELKAQHDGVAWRGTDELTPERHAFGRAELAFLEREIAKLDPRCRRVFYLHRYEGKSQTEIAAVMGLGLTTVYKDLKKAMAHLVEARRRFEGDRNDKE